MERFFQQKFASALLCATALGASAAHAQDDTVPPPAVESQAEAAVIADENVIIVTAPSTRGVVIGDIAPEATLDAADVASYGAGSVEELLESLSPQTGSARGRGGGRPVILVNGQRISGFREIRDLPPEAIERVEIFPEELALRYGFRPDQRVVNLVLRANFAAVTAEAEHGLPTQSGFSASEIEATLTRIDGAGRLNLDLEVARSSALTEAERDIVQPEGEPTDAGEFRTLVPASERIEANASYNRQFGSSLAATLSGEYQIAESRALLGLEGMAPVERDTSTRAGELGLTVNGQAGGWRWAATGNYARSAVTTETSGAEGDEIARGVSQSADADATVSGSPFALPAGPVALSLATGFEWRAIDSRTEREGLVSAASLSRERWNARANIDVPLTSRRDDVLAAIGDLSLSGNLGYSRLSDFGALTEYGYGINWEPIEGLSLLASVIGEEAAPSVEQLGDPAIVTPGVLVFDFARGESVAIDRITGGNPALLAESRRDFKLTANFAPGDSRDVRLIAEYIRNRSENVASAFPLLTPEIEAAFPDRVTRDAAGNLVAIDARPVSFAETRGERIRYGVNLSGRIGAEEEEGEGRGRRGGGQGEAPSPASFIGRRGGGGSRWQLSVYHVWRLAETVLIRPGAPLLDLLDGSVSGGAIPVSRHGVEIEGGFSLDGIGLRAEAEYLGAARVDGGDSGADDLFFGDLLTLDLRAFVDFDQRPRLIEAAPWLAGGRLSLSIDNLFGGARRVTDGDGVIPLSFQPGLLDPRGRFVELSFRKRF